jgi:hypothetical protein
LHEPADAVLLVLGGALWPTAIESGDHMLKDVQLGKTELAVYNLGLLLGDPTH